MKKGILSVLLIGSASLLFAQAGSKRLSADVQRKAKEEEVAKRYAEEALAKRYAEEDGARRKAGGDPIVMTVGKEEVPLSEFEAIFLKNHPKDQPVTKAELDEYSALFVNFKLKVQAAKLAGIDTTVAFKNEFNGYKKQLGQPYLKDKATEDRMLDEVLERVKTDLRVSHILVKAKNDCMSPSDTAELYKKALEIRKRLLKGEAFEKVANEVSEDSYSNKVGGDLGWFSGLMWSYPFESAAYNLKKGELSMPVKTNLGYHIVKVTDNRAARGEVKAAHIFVASAATQNAEDKAKADAKIKEAYAALKAGTPWADVVNKYSEDKTSVAAGGELPAFGINKMVQEFEDAAFALKNEGDYSEPFATKYGFHIVKLVSRTDKKAETVREETRKVLQKNVRNKLIADAFVQKAKKELSYTENTALIGRIKAMEAVSKNKTIRLTALDSVPDEVLFTLGGNSYKISEFSEYIKAKMPRAGEINYCNLESKYLNPFVEQKALEMAENNLENKYPEYKALLKEYREGIMIFDMMDKKVWSKSVEDTTGLKSFFNNNRGNYMWKKRIAAYRVIGSDSLTLEKVKKEAEKVVSGKKTISYLTDKFNKKEAVIVVNEDLKEFGESAELDALGTTPKLGNVSKSKENWYFYIVSGVREPEQKDLKSAKGIVISDYQNYLEQEWLKELKASYPVSVNKDVMYKLAK